MLPKPKNYYKAVGVIVGYIVGVGMFSLPYLVVKAGVLNFFLLFIGLGLVKYFVHLIYANLIIATPGFHRMPGYAGIYLGAWGKHSVFAAKLIGNIGALLAYTIISGTFLYGLLGPYFGGAEFWYGSVFFGLGALIVLLGLTVVARAELLMSILLFAVVFLIVGKGFFFVDPAHYFALDWKYFLLPYGAMFFALDGCGAMPIVAKLLNKDKQAVKSAIKAGMSVSVLITVLFVLAIAGISGPDTSPDALVGIKAVLNNGVVTLAMLFGVLSIATSFILVAEAVTETLQWDYLLSRFKSWGLALLLPFGLYLAGIRDLTSVISLAGGVAGGFSSLILILVYWRLKNMPDLVQMFRRPPADIWLYSLILLFLTGLVYELWHFFS